jgi:hypothetical protein
MDPAVISGGAFGQLWSFNVPTTYNGLAEQFFAKPLVYTPSSTGRQVVIAFSEQNRIYSLDAVNGTLYATRDLRLEGETPFLVSDLGNCNDISGTIGITGTPVIDNTTDTIYFWAKSYKTPTSPTGYQNGAYRFHAIDAVTLQERPGFPTSIEGQYADNDKTRYFTGGSVLQRASLNLIGGVVYAGFGGHCDMYNYTGWLVGMKASTGAFVTGYATSGGDRANPQDGTWNGGGGGCGIWMSGAAITSDGPGRLFYATGNGYRTMVNGQQAASGRSHLDTLSEAMVNMKIEDDGTVTQYDYFEPYTYAAIDAADRDLGSSGVSILPFSGGGVSRLAVTCGKNGQCYVTNADNMGGYKMGSGGGDAVIQTITPEKGSAMFGAVGSYPLEGGYMYITPVGAPTYAYAVGKDASGRPAFISSGSSPDNSAGRVGVGPVSLYYPPKLLIITLLILNFFRRLSLLSTAKPEQVSSGSRILMQVSRPSRLFPSTASLSQSPCPLLVVLPSSSDLSSEMDATISPLPTRLLVLVHLLLFRLNARLHSPSVMSRLEHPLL